MRAPRFRHHLVLGAQRPVVDDARCGRPADLAVAGSGDNATAVGLYSAIVTALLSPRAHRQGIPRHHPRCSPKASGPQAFPSRARVSGLKFHGLHDRKNPQMRAERVSAADGTWFLLIVTPDKLAEVAESHRTARSPDGIRDFPIRRS